MSSYKPCRVSVVIKTLNEEKKVVAAIESALKALENVGGEVVLADSCSTDRTVELASRYPVRIVRLADAAERSCGIGPQLGYQHARGEFIYILDGDMELVPGFFEQALPFLAQHPELGGLGGHVIECNLDSLEFRERSLREAAHKHSGPVDRLDCGGMYRRRAIEEAGYFSDRNLHSYEEFDLAVRLRARGWKLWRLPVDAARHYGHDLPPYELLQRRWRSGYVCGLGEVVRAAWGQPHLRGVLRGVRELRLYAAVIAWWLLLASVVFWPMPGLARAATFAVMAVFPLAAMWVRKRSLERAAYAVSSWCVCTAGLLRGLMRRRVPPRQPIASEVLREPGDPSSVSFFGGAPGSRLHPSPDRQNNA